MDGYSANHYDGGEAMNYEGNFYRYSCSYCGEYDDELLTDEDFQYLDSGLEEDE